MCQITALKNRLASITANPDINQTVKENLRRELVNKIASLENKEIVRK